MRTLTSLHRGLWNHRLLHHLRDYLHLRYHLHMYASRWILPSIRHLLEVAE
jgi:hypothetical protein